MKFPKRIAPMKDLDAPPDWFWDVIEAASGDREQLRTILRDAPPAALIAFPRIYRLARGELDADPIAHRIDGSASEDTVLDFADWIVAQGRAVYTQALDEESLPVVLERLPRNPNLIGVADDVHLERYGKPIPDE